DIRSTAVPIRCPRRQIDQAHVSSNEPHTVEDTAVCFSLISTPNAHYSPPECPAIQPFGLNRRDRRRKRTASCFSARENVGLGLGDILGLVVGHLAHFPSIKLAFFF